MSERQGSIWCSRCAVRFQLADRRWEPRWIHRCGGTYEGQAVNSLAPAVIVPSDELPDLTVPVQRTKQEAFLVLAIELLRSIADGGARDPETARDGALRAADFVVAFDEASLEEEEEQT